MADGWETRRRRGPGNDWAIVRLAAAGTIERLEIDTRTSRATRPARCVVEGTRGHAERRLARAARDAAAAAHAPRVRRRAAPDRRRSRTCGCRCSRAAASRGCARRRLAGASRRPASRALQRARRRATRRRAAALLRLAGAGPTQMAARAAVRGRRGAAAHRRARVVVARPRPITSRRSRAHPQIGEARPTTPRRAWSAGEQRAAAGAGDATLAALAEAQPRLRGERFGFIFIVCATGRRADEMLAELRARLDDDRDAELRTAAEEQAKITRLRLAQAARRSSHDHDPRPRHRRRPPRRAASRSSSSALDGTARGSSSARGVTDDDGRLRTLTPRARSRRHVPHPVRDRRVLRDRDVAGSSRSSRSSSSSPTARSTTTCRCCLARSATRRTAAAELQRAPCRPHVAAGKEARQGARARRPRAGSRFAQRYPGDAGARQPVHTVYGGAHLFTADTAQKLGELALRALDTYAPDARDVRRGDRPPRRSRRQGLRARARQARAASRSRTSASTSRTATATAPTTKRTATPSPPRSEVARGARRRHAAAVPRHPHQAAHARARARARCARSTSS